MVAVIHELIKLTASACTCEVASGGMRYAGSLMRRSKTERCGAPGANNNGVSLIPAGPREGVTSHSLVSAKAVL